jgi:DNA repair ATPase RecN
MLVDRIIDRLRSLSIVIQDVHVLLPEPEADGQQQQMENLQQIVANCRNVLRDLEKTRDKYTGVDSRHRGLSGKVKKVWKRFQFDPEEIQGLRQRITSNITLLNMFIEQLSR